MSQVTPSPSSFKQGHAQQGQQLLPFVYAKLLRLAVRHVTKEAPKETQKELKLLLVIALGLFTGGSTAQSQTNAAPQNWVVRESALGQTQPETERIAVVFSQDARHVAIARTKENVVTIEKGGKDLVISGEFQHMILSPNGSRLAFSVKTAAGDKLVLDGRESVMYRQVLTNSFAFSADSRRFGYLAYQGSNLVAVLEAPSQASASRARAGSDARLPDLGETGDPPLLQISADGQHVAHVAITNSQFCVVHDGRYGRLFRNGVGAITLSPDGKRLAYIGVEGKTQMLVLDGKVVAESTGSDSGGDLANAIAFSPDNQRFAYSHRRGGRWILWVDGHEGEAFDAFGKASIRFSPNSRRIAFAAVNQGKWLVVADGQRSVAAFDLVGTKYSPVFSPDSRHVAYSAKLDGEWFLVVDDEEQPTRYASIKSMAFSSDSRHLAYHARRQDGWHLIVDSKPVGNAYVAVSSLVFDTAANLHFIGERHLETNKHEFVLVEAELTGGEGIHEASH
jgi:hypothetical protein